MKRVIVRSVHDAFDYVMQHYYPFGLEDLVERADTYAVISIQDTHTGGFGLKFAESHFCKGVLTLYFDDVLREVKGAVMFTDEMADQIVEKLGQVDYAVPYTALMSEDKATIKLTLSPETLKLTLPGDSGNDGEEGGATTTSEGSEEGENDTEIEVTITSDAEGTYTLESKSLVFGLAATAVKLNGQEMPFEGLSLSFELTKK